MTALLLIVFPHLIGHMLLFLIMQSTLIWLQTSIFFLSNVTEYMITKSAPSLFHWLYNIYHGCLVKSNIFCNQVIAIHCLNGISSYTYYTHAYPFDLNKVIFPNILKSPIHLDLNIISDRTSYFRKSLIPNTNIMFIKVEILRLNKSRTGFRN